MFTPASQTGNMEAAGLSGAEITRRRWDGNAQPPPHTALLQPPGHGPLGAPTGPCSSTTPVPLRGPPFTRQRSPEGGFVGVAGFLTDPWHPWVHQKVWVTEGPDLLLWSRQLTRP